ncbi:SIS domain-containing protein [Azospirillum cavernae]|uniref:SIS domain-containing protein n=1 Tax=Azospirillum cavernae TaxID=2320860 RepID=A0A418VL94_9PROT|nr:SIS domain-containing protein [Azospirillum cavernae]RJF76901.1 SIS domain-containing protein [Azospirillum cavernae]
MTVTSYTSDYLDESIRIIRELDRSVIDRMAQILADTREGGGRLFILGVGGGAGHASHAVNDFRKIAGIESYTPTDNVSELTARINDEGWDSSFRRWLEVSRIAAQDTVLVFSVGGGNIDLKVSMNIVEAVKLAKERGARVLGVVGRDGGYTAQVGDAVVIVPTVNPATVTPHTEAFQAVVWHLVVSHPALKRHEMAWESKQTAIP